MHFVSEKILFLPPENGEMAERSIAAVLKTVEGNTSGGSNPSLSAKNELNEQSLGSFFVLTHTNGCGISSGKLLKSNDKTISGNWNQLIMQNYCRIIICISNQSDINKMCLKEKPVKQFCLTTIFFEQTVSCIRLVP